jgi:acylglycerol lipase
MSAIPTSYPLPLLQSPVAFGRSSVYFVTMIHQEDRFLGPDGLELHEQYWLPEAKSTAAVGIVHGFQEHGGRYAELAEVLTRNGYCAYALDLRGHGRSEGPRVMVSSFEEYLADLDIFLDRIHQRESDKPVFLFGHSMGAAIVALIAITRQPQIGDCTNFHGHHACMVGENGTVPFDSRKIAGIILSAPPVQVGGQVFPVLRHLAGWVSRVWPSLRLVHMGSRFISRDPEVVADFRRDPLVYHGRFPVRTGAEILRAGKQIQDSANLLRLPLLILHGTGDLVTSSEGSRLLHMRAGSCDKTLHLYEGLYHDLLHEPEKEHVKADIVAWIKEKSNK